MKQKLEKLVLRLSRKKWLLPLLLGLCIALLAACGKSEPPKAEGGLAEPPADGAGVKEPPGAASDIKEPPGADAGVKEPPGADAGVKERAESVQAALRLLPAAYREVIVLHRWHELSFPEIAEILGTTEGAVKVRAHRGYLKLRELLQEEGVA